jgi:hypothetical protein
MLGVDWNQATVVPPSLLDSFSTSIPALGDRDSLEKGGSAMSGETLASGLLVDTGDVDDGDRVLDLEAATVAVPSFEVVLLIEGLVSLLGVLATLLDTVGCLDTDRETVAMASAVATAATTGPALDGTVTLEVINAVDAVADARSSCSGCVTSLTAGRLTVLACSPSLAGTIASEAVKYI